LFPSTRSNREDTTNELKGEISNGCEGEKIHFPSQGPRKRAKETRSKQGGGEKKPVQKMKLDMM